jgi:hypothetical protein
VVLRGRDAAYLLSARLILVAILLLLSNSHRSGPLLPDPFVARDVQLEFGHSLGALYEKAGATNTTVRVAYDRFRLMLGWHTGAPRTGSSATERTQEIVSLVSARDWATSAPIYSRISRTAKRQFIPQNLLRRGTRCHWCGRCGNTKIRCNKAERNHKEKEETSGRTEHNG